jgi:peptide deformylase
MPSREVLRMGDARLLRVAEKVTVFDSAELHALIADLRVVIFEVEANPRYPEAESVPQTVLINPQITRLKSKKEEDWEGCLSVPGMRGIVPRFTHIRYQGYDEYGAVIDRSVSDFHARVVQHECDHLDGILYPMRMTDLSKLGYTDVLFPGQDIGDD